MKCPKCGHEFASTKTRSKKRLSREETMAKQRGCWVSEEHAADWKTFKSAGYTNEEARASLGLPKYEPTGRPARRTVPSRRASAGASSPIP